MSESLLIEVARVWLAGLFLLAGTMKVVRPSTARKYAARKFGMSVEHARLTVALVAMFESGVAIGILLGVQLFLVTIATFSALLVFTLISLSDSENLDCGCFGTDNARGDPRVLIAFRNGAMAAISLYVAQETSPQPVSDVTSFTLGFVVLVSSVSGYLVMRVLLDENHRASSTTRGELQ